MPAISIPTPFNIDLEFNIASAGRRLLGFLIDCTLLRIYAIAVSQIFIFGFDYESSLAVNVMQKIFFWFPILFYGFLMELLFNGQTVGKMLLGMRVVNMTGNRAGISQYLIRAVFGPFLLLAPFVMITIDVMGDPVLVLLVLSLLGIGIFVLFLMSPKVQRLGDRLADTLVINTRAKTDIHSTIFREVEDENYSVRFPEVMRLTDRDINGIRNLLHMKAGNRDTENYIARIAGRVTSILGIETALEPRDFLEQLLMDYNFLSRK